ncbi:hypothetical protein DFJ74DRAFT_708269 [Hyaloraphidium curvatum]|nr:hypothetical protein DFJ74DRAFT_708269 [Hyaloraphidium curvatum]
MAFGESEPAALPVATPKPLERKDSGVALGPAMTTLSPAPAPAPPTPAAHPPRPRDTLTDALRVIDTGCMTVLPAAHLDCEKAPGALAKVSRAAEKLAAAALVTLPAAYFLLVTVGQIYAEVQIFIE